MSKRTKLVILSILIVSLGFLRDYLFININWIYMHLVAGRPNQAMHEFHFLLDWTPGEINALKWLLTILFTLLFLGLTYLVVQLAFAKREFNRITIYTYAGLIVLSAALYGLDYLVGPSDEIYGVIRTFMGWAQSFLPLMVLYILFKFLPGLNSGQSSE
jgi:hypothetical protein